jgi:hypothetical protein
VILQVGARQFELWMLISSFTLSKEEETECLIYVLAFGHYTTFHSSHQGMAPLLISVFIFTQQAQQFLMAFGNMAKAK